MLEKATLPLPGVGRCQLVLANPSSRTAAAGIPRCCGELDSVKHEYLVRVRFRFGKCRMKPATNLDLRQPGQLGLVEKCGQMETSPCAIG